MMYLTGAVLSAALTAASAAIPMDSLELEGPPGGIPPGPAEQTIQISVLTFNVHGLPWPLADGRGAALKAIGRELAARRAAGRQPDVVLIQEGFRGEIADLVRVSGYHYWAQGPKRSDRPPARPRTGQGDYPKVRYPLAGEGWGKFTGSGLHVLSDLPIVEVQSEAYRNCAGLDCLANKGVMLVRVQLPDSAGVADIVNTHMNAKRASRTPTARTLLAHNLQTEQLLAFIKREHAPDAPLLVGGDFNVKGAPARYAYGAAKRPYVVVSEYCDAVEARCEGQAPAAQTKPWLRSQDLQAFKPGGPVDVRPVVVATLFDKARGERALSDHAAYLVRYRLNWTAAVQDAAPPVQVKPTLGTWGVKVSWRR